MANTSIRFKVLRCFLLCAGFAVSSPVSVMAQIATLGSSEVIDFPETSELETQVEIRQPQNFAKPKALTFEYAPTQKGEEEVGIAIADANLKQAKKAPTAKIQQAKKAPTAKIQQTKAAKLTKKGCEIFFQGITTSGSDFTVVNGTRSETLIQIFEDEASFVAGESALQVIQYSPGVSGATAPGARVGSLIVTSTQSNELTFEYHREQTITQSSYSVVRGTVDDDNEAYILVSQSKGGKCRIGKKLSVAKTARKCKQGEIFLQNTTPNPGPLTSAANCETLVQIFDSDTVTTFTDVSTTYWASTYIYQLVALHIVRGFPGGVFRPDEALTQAHFSAIVSRAFDVPTVRETVSIRNLSSSYWAYSDFQRAYAMGFIDNIANGVDPDRALTKLDVLVAIAKGLKYTEVSSGSSVDEILSVFSDASTIPVQYRPYIAALVQKGVLVNHSNTSVLNLNEVITRAETCALVYQSLVGLGEL